MYLIIITTFFYTAFAHRLAFLAQNLLKSNKNNKNMPYVLHTCAHSMSSTSSRYSEDVPVYEKLTLYTVSQKSSHLSALCNCQILTNFQKFCIAGTRTKFAIKPFDINHFTLGMLLMLNPRPELLMLSSLLKCNVEWVLQQISYALQQCKKSENRLRFDSCREFKGGNFFGTL